MRRLFALLAGLLAGSALAQSLPSLYFDAPPGFTGGGTEVATFTAPEGDVVVHVYPFRRLGPGEFEARFRETLLREFVAAGLREGKLAAAPGIETVGVEGADTSLMAKFTDGQREHNRLAMLSGGAVAVIDFTASGAAAAQRQAETVKALLDSISVGQPKARAAPPPLSAAPEVAATTSAAAAAPVIPAAPAIAAAPATPAAPAPQAAAPLPGFQPGVYVGNVRRLIPSYVGGVQSGGMWVSGPQYFVFSGDGRAHRNYEQPRVPGGDVARFDWTRAQQSDAGNTGTYEVLGNVLTLRLGTETISAKLAGPGRFEIFGTYFKRTTLK